MERLRIYPNDERVVSRRSERYCRNLISQIKKKFSKENHQLVTIEEFCQYIGLCFNSVRVASELIFLPCFLTKKQGKKTALWL